MTLRTWVAGAAVLILGVGLGAGGAWVARGQDRAVIVGAYEVSHDDVAGGEVITVWLNTGAHPVITLWSVEEKPDRVEVTVRERAGGMRTLDVRPGHRLTWPLREPLGSRRVIDTSTGRDIPRSISARA
jgi:hypothetical protein